MGPLEVQASVLRKMLTRPINVLLLLVLDAVIWLQRSDIVDFHNRVQDIPAQFIYDVYDFVIIGGGSGGATMAARLSEICDWNVLLLEAGPDETYLTDLPYLFPILQKSELDWKFKTEPNPAFCQGMTDNQCAWPRGKVLGGGSTLNAMMYIRGNPEDYNDWERQGNVGWSWKDVLPYFIKLENVRDPKIANQPWHGKTGPITVELFRNHSALTPFFLEAARQMNQTIADEMNGPSQHVFGPLHGTIRNGLRCSTAKGYLRPVSNRKNLHISLNSMVEKILIDPTDKRAYGVRFVKDNQRHYVIAMKEVILSAGTLNSPQLLMLSGVGPREELEANGIDVIQELPGVGQNLQDHVATGGLTFLIQNPYNDSFLSSKMSDALSTYTIRDLLFSNSGPLLSMPFCEVMGFINTKYQPENGTRPDVQLFMASQSEVTDGGVWGTYSSSISPTYFAKNYEQWIFHDSFFILPLLARPESRGYLKLRSNSVYDKIMIYPNYFAVRRDVDILIEALKFCRQLALTPALQQINATLIYDVETDSTCRHETGDEFYECLIRHFSQTIYHPVGTNAMGPRGNPMAVVDDKLKVHGIIGLRVVDASIMPTIVSGNTNVPTIMIAERTADVVKADYLPLLLKRGPSKSCNTYNFQYN